MSEGCCRNCHKPLIRGEKEKRNLFRRRKYCDHRCAAAHRRTVATARVGERACRWCGQPLVRRPNEIITVFKRRRNCVPHRRKPEPKPRVARRPAPQPKPVVARQKPTPVGVSSIEIADMVAAYLVHHTVSRCPTAAVEHTTATVPVADRQALRQYREDMDRQWNSKSLKQRRTEFLI